MANRQSDYDLSLLKDVVLEAKDAESVTAKLEAYILPEPVPQATQQLINSLVPHLAKPKEEGFRNRMLQGKPVYSLGLLARLGFAQISPTALPFWWLTTTVMLLGAAWVSIHQDGLLAWSPLLITMPLLAILATCWFFRPKERAIAEVEATCPVGPRQLAMAQLLATLICLFLLALPLTALVAFYDSSSPLSSLLFGWLAPMLLFTVLTLQVSIHAGGFVGMLVGGSLWSLYVVSLLRDWTLLPPPQSMEQWLMASLLIAFALMALTVTALKMRTERRQLNA